MAAWNRSRNSGQSNPGRRWAALPGDDPARTNPCAQPLFRVRLPETSRPKWSTAVRDATTHPAVDGRTIGRTWRGTAVESAGFVVTVAAVTVELGVAASA